LKIQDREVAKSPRGKGGGCIKWYQSYIIYFCR
jgi:hypothetical protein